MTVPKIKFCGLTRNKDVEAALSVGADLLGFIVECKSPRRLSVRDAARLSLPAKGLAKTVAVTVNADNQKLSAIAQQMQPDFIQFHGDETPDQLRHAKLEYGVGLIKALSVASAEDLRQASTYFDVADALLLDATPPKDEGQRGGHGQSFDWSLLDGFEAPIPVILAGGLSPDTIAEAMKMTNAHIFDVSSGIEAAPGIKDATLMATFMKAARHE